MIQKVSIIGCGSFGYALCLLLANAHRDAEVSICDNKASYIDVLRRSRRHPFFHTVFIAPANVMPTLDRASCVKDSDVVILAVPTQVMRSSVARLAGFIPKKAVVLNTAKALEDGSGKRMSEVIREELALHRKSNAIATISGGMVAADVLNGCFIGADIGCENQGALSFFGQLFAPTRIHAQFFSDLAAIEYAGAFKNIAAILAGIADGLQLNASSKAFFIVRMMAELEELIIQLGAKQPTFLKLKNSWDGDVLASCYGSSRNRYFGELIGRGQTMKEALEIIELERKRAEGVSTLKIVSELVRKHRLSAPLLDALYRIVHKGENAKILLGS